MVSVSCDQCGTSFNLEDSDLPPSGKIMKCTGCGTSITVMQPNATEMGFTTPKRPAGTVSGLGKPPPIPKSIRKPKLGIPGSVPPVPPVPAKAPPGLLDLGDPLGGPVGPLGAPVRNRRSALDDAEQSRVGNAADPTGITGIANPGRGSALDLAEPVASAPAPRSALADALGSSVAATPAAAFGASDALSLDDLADLPAPVGPTSSKFADLPAPVGPTASKFADLPAPVGPTASKFADLPAPVGPTASKFADLPAPVGPTSSKFADLPAPVGPTSSKFADLPAPVGPTSSKFADLPAPVGPTSSKFADLPAPVGPTSSKFADLPAPVGPTSSKFADLPAPVGPTSSKHVDLPAPVGPTSSKFADLPAPVGPTSSKHVDLPAPKGFFDDIPAPAGIKPIGVGASPPSADLPAPKGFFDDLPAPAGASVANSPSSSPSLPSPKGFFDDAVAAAKPEGGFFGGDNPASAAANTLNGIGGKGLDALSPIAAAPAALELGVQDSGIGGLAGSIDLGDPGSSELPALDLGAPIGDGSMNLGGSLQDDDAGANDLGGGQPLALDFGPPPSSSGGGSGDALDFGPPPSSSGSGSGDALDFGPPPSSSGGGALDLDSLDLGLGADVPAALELPGDSAGGSSFGEVDLPTSGAAAPDLGVVSFSKPAPSLDVGGASSHTSGPPPNDALELADVGDEKKPAARRNVSSATPAKKHNKASETSKTSKKTSDKGEKKKLTLTRTHKLIAVGVALLIAIGGGGFYFYQKQQAKAGVRTRADKLVKRARTLLASDKVGHWDAAARTASQALSITSKHADALGIAAQAHYAAFLDTGIGHDARVGKARGFFRTITKNDLEGIEIDKAEALGEITTGKLVDLNTAIATLRKVLSKARGDADAQLYLGWAYSAQHNFSAAVQSFGAALKKNPNRIPALYGQALSYMALGKKKQAREAFGKIIQRNSSHVGAQIGNAQLLELPSLADREQRYLEILQRKDIAKGDPRSVSLAWSLAGDLALLAGRVDEAKQRYDQAFKLDRTNMRAAVGKAKAALKQNRLASARDKLTTVLDTDNSNIEARLTLAEVELAAGELSAAQDQIDKLKARKPPLEGNTELARLYMTQGALAEARADKTAEADTAKYDLALGFYENAQKHAATTDVRPIVARSSALQKAGRGAEAILVLKDIEAKAESDPALAVTLGLAHFNTKSLEKAEAWFRKALALKPDNVEAQFQLGLTLYARKQHEPALASLRKAYDTDMARDDIGLQLAVILEELTRDDEAEALYVKLLAGKAPSLNVRGRAGRFYVRKGQAEKVQKLGKEILAESPRHPTGLFLRAESRYIKGVYVDAVRYYKDAVRIDPAPQFLDGLGRAYEKLKPPISYDQALQAYRRAAKADKTYLSPRLGIARIYLTRLSTQTLAEAIASLEDARRLDPKNPWIYYGLGACFRKRGNLVNEAKQRRRPNFDRALTHYRTALKLDSKRAALHWGIADLYYELNRPREAARSFANAVRLGEAMAKEPTWLADALFKWARSARASGDRRGALRALDKLEGRDPRGAIAQEIKKMKLELRGGR